MTELAGLTPEHFLWSVEDEGRDGAAQSARAEEPPDF